MGTLIGPLLLVVLAYCAFRAAQRVFAYSRTDSPRIPSNGGDVSTPSEVHERELANQLVAGLLEPDAYQRAMSELAHRDRIGAGGSR